jgi:hypothetical protein
LVAIRPDLRFGHSERDKRVTGESPDRIHNVPPKRQRLASYAEQIFALAI